MAGPEIVKLWFGQSPEFGPPTVWPWPNEIYRFGDYAVNADEAATIVFTVVVVLGLGALFRWSALGLQMRAVVESPRMTELAGINADRVEHLRRGCCPASSPAWPASCWRRCSPRSTTTTSPP